jgi:hypothetical protein
MITVHLILSKVQHTFGLVVSAFPSKSEEYRKRLRGDKMVIAAVFCKIERINIATTSRLSGNTYLSARGNYETPCFKSTIESGEFYVPYARCKVHTPHCFIELFVPIVV